MAASSPTHPIPYVRGLHQLISEGRLAAILSRTGRQSERRRRRPADSVAWLVIALALFAADSIAMVWRRLHPTLDQPEPTDSAFPQVRPLALCGLGTHALCALAIKPLRHGEPSMVGPLLDQLGPSDLLIWDRGFFNFELIASVVRQGAHLLARVKSNSVLRPIRRLPDGSFLAKIYPSPADRRSDTNGLVVRVVEYTHDDPNRPGMGQRHRPITDPLNPEDMRAGEAPLVYHERWEQVLAFDEIKTHLRGYPVTVGCLFGYLNGFGFPEFGASRLSMFWIEPTLIIDSA